MDKTYKLNNVVGVLLGDLFVCGLVIKEEDLAKLYPNYGFEKHKGYLTKDHLEALKQYGPCGIHRLTYKPVKDSIKV